MDVQGRSIPLTGEMSLVDDGFDSRIAWRYGTALAIGYMLARGIAKAGKGTYEDD